MDSEPELDSVGGVSPPVEAELPANSQKRKPTAKRAAQKRDPNEAILENWQRRQHLADRMDAPRPKTATEGEPLITDEGVNAENYSLRINGYVYVYEPLTATENRFETWDTPLPAFRIGRITEICAAEEFSKIQIVVNWALRANEVYVRAGYGRKNVDTREVYVTKQYAHIGIESIRGECVVQHEQEIRTLAKFREKASQFYFTKYYDHVTRRLHDTVPLSALKSRVSALKLEKLGLMADYAIVTPELLTILQETPKTKRGGSVAPEGDDYGEDSADSVDVDQCQRDKNRWPFRFWDEASQNWGQPAVRNERVGAEYQCAIDEWPGAPLKYYTKGRPRSRGSPPPLKWVEGDDMVPQDADLNQGWVQEMPSGYIPRGGDATSLVVSLPSPELADFVALCQKSYSAPLEIAAENLNFLDACCAAYTHNGTADRALPVVARLSKRGLVPDLGDEDLPKFLQLMNPLQNPDWSHVYRKMGNKPFLELCLFYWSQLPHKISYSDQLTGDQAVDNQMLRCIECHTDQTPEWMPLPWPVLTFPGVNSSTGAENNDPKLALCARCARLWFRYRTGWKRCSEVKPEEQDPSQIEPELLDDANAYLTEQERRAKRRQAAAEKREATTKRKFIEKEAKQAAKRLKKEIKANGGVVPSTNTENSDPAASDVASGPTPAALGAADSKTTTESAASATTDNALGTTKPDPKPKTPRGKAKASAPSSSTTTSKRETKSRAGSKPKAKDQAKDDSVSADAKPTDDESTTEDSDSNSLRTKGSKRRNVLDTQLSLDLVDEILASLDEEIEPEDQDVPKTCPVCGQDDPSMPQLTCASCLVTVHAACYGASLAVNENETWFCDCCRNSRGKSDQVLDMNYQCELCPPRSPEYASWQAGVVGNHAPDLLKPTLTKRWCHIRCAIFNPKISFSNPKQLTGIDTLGAGMSISDESQACRICQEHHDSQCDAQGLTPVPTIYLAESDQLRSITVSQSSSVPPSRMGSTIKCELCNDYFHVSCAADHQFFLGLTGNNTRATIICRRHLRADSEPENYGLTPFSRVNTNLNMTALQLFVSKYKQSVTKAMSSMMRVREYQIRERAHLHLGTTTLQELAVNESQELSVVRLAMKCDQCQTTHSNFWHLGPDGKKQCSWCHRGYMVTSQPPENRSFWTPFLSKAGRFPNTDRQKPSSSRAQ